jgi:hypothetical protein
LNARTLLADFSAASRMLNGSVLGSEAFVAWRLSGVGERYMLFLKRPLSQLQPLIKTFGNKTTILQMRMLVFVGDVPALLRRPLLLPTCMFLKICFH